MSPLRIKVSSKLPLVLFLIFFLLGLFTFRNFGISIETDDVIDFSSYEKGKEILKKYKVII